MRHSMVVVGYAFSTTHTTQYKSVCMYVLVLHQLTIAINCTNLISARVTEVHSGLSSTLIYNSAIEQVASITKIFRDIKDDVRRGLYDWCA